MNHQRVDEWGRVVLSEQGLLELFYKGISHSSELVAENIPEVEEYNKWCKVFDATDKQIDTHQPLEVDPEAYHAERQADWLMPQEYQTLDVEQWLIGKCTEQAQIDRVSMELALFKKHDMYGVLRLFIYITDALRDQNVLWGVGRGSSVSSYCLFLIGVHRIDSLKYDLDIKEFIRE